MPEYLWSYTALARCMARDDAEFNKFRFAIPVVVDGLRIRPKPIPYNSQARGLNLDDARRVAKFAGRLSEFESTLALSA